MKEPGLNLRLLYSARYRESIDRLVVVISSLNGQNSPYSSCQKLDEDEEAGGKNKRALPFELFELSTYCPPNFHLQILTFLLGWLRLTPRI